MNAIADPTPTIPYARIDSHSFLKDTLKLIVWGMCTVYILIVTTDPD